MSTNIGDVSGIHKRRCIYNLCPQRTLNDIPCKTYSGRFPNHLDRCKDEFGPDYTLHTSPDCSNVESCAIPTCQATNYNDVGENRYIPVYAGCSSSILPVELHPTETPPATALVLTCRNDGGEGYIRGNNLSTDPNDIRLMKEFDTCIYNVDGRSEQQQQQQLTPNEIRQCRDLSCKENYYIQKHV